MANMKKQGEQAGLRASRGRSEETPTAVHLQLQSYSAGQRNGGSTGWTVCCLEEPQEAR